MESNIYNHDFKKTRIADIGGREVLGMGGSLSGYIATGNAYNRDYYEPSSKKSTKKQLKKDNIKDIAMIGTVILAGITVVATAIKLNKNPLKMDGLRFNISDKFHSFIDKIKGIKPKKV